ncbi:MAG: carbohydrate ABC transporter permease, partial [Streptococcus sp.]|nr:carbohydrate ABC transporter permease [Streptococcus sp.]
MKKKKKKIASLSVRGFNRPVNFIFYIFIALFAISCVLPFLFVLAISLTKESALQQYGYSFFPREWSFYAYTFLFDQMKEKMLQSLFVTILVTVLGTVINATATSLYAYAISRNNFPFRR